MSEDRIFLGLPSHDGRLDCETAAAMGSSGAHIARVSRSSGLNWNCNVLYAQALNARSDGVNWFAMLHSDVSPCGNWLTQMLSLAKQYGADMLSAVIPIKDQSGMTSTALRRATIRAGDERNTNPLRLTMRQVNYQDFPKVFDAELAVEALRKMPWPLVAHLPQSVLLANTGCMVLRLDRQWSEDLVFETEDWIEKREGKFIARNFPEDWRLSEQVTTLGGRVMATTLVRCVHRGIHDYDSAVVWGKNYDGEQV